MRGPRFRDLVAELASPLRGIPKDDLIGEDIRQYRRLNTWRNIAFCTVTLLFVAAVVAAVVAFQQRTLHASGVTSVALSPDGRILATGSFDKTARLWEVATGREMAALRGHDAPVSSVAFSPDGRLLATGTQGKTAHLWDVAWGSEAAVIRGNDAFATAVAFSPDGQALATGSYDETYQFWDVSTRQQTVSWRGQKPPARRARDSRRHLFSAPMGASWPQAQRTTPLAYGNP